MGIGERNEFQSLAWVRRLRNKRHVFAPIWDLLRDFAICPEVSYEMNRWSAIALVFFLALSQPIARSESLVQKASSFAKLRANPYTGHEAARQAGRKLFHRECSGCHGDNGQGNGRRRTPPLATLDVKDADPGTLFWILRNGSASHAMPSFSQLPEQQRWQIITYLQSLSTQ